MMKDEQNEHEMVRTTGGPLARPGRDDAYEIAPIGPDAYRDGDWSAGGPRPLPFRQLLGYRWTILAMFVVFAAIFLGAVWGTVVPKYTATAAIEVSPVIPQLLAGESDMVPLYESYRQSQVDRITGPEVLDNVLDRADVRATRWYRQDPVTPFERLKSRLGWWNGTPPRDRLANEIRATAPARKQLVLVSMTSQTRGEARMLVNAVVQEYARFARDRVTGNEGEAKKQLREELRKSTEELMDVERKVADVRETLGTGTPDQLVQQRLLRTDELNAELSRLRMDLAVKQRLLTEISAGVASAPDFVVSETPELAPAVRFGQDRTWQRLTQELDNARREALAAAGRLGESHPTMIQMNKAVEEAQRRLTERESELGDSGLAVSDQAPELIKELRTLRIQISELEGLVQKAETDSGRVSEAAERLTKLSTDSERLQKLHDTLSNRLYELEMNSQVAGQIGWSSAYEPSTPSIDSRMKFGAAALAAAMMLAIGLTLVRIRATDTVTEASEVFQPAAGTFLGYLPLRRTGRNAISLEQCPEQAEAVRMIRTALLSRTSGKSSYVVHISSAGVGAGKSTLATLLGQSLARCGKKVLLVDADVRRPSLARRFALDPSPGLLDVLADGDPESACMRPTADANLTVVPSGVAVDRGDAELLANGVFSAQLQNWRESHDVIILDSPPLLSNADGAILSRHADGTIVLVRERHCRRGELADALDVLTSCGGRLLGVVFVGSQRGRHSYGYGYGPMYGHESVPVAPARTRDSAGGGVA